MRLAWALVACIVASAARAQVPISDDPTAVWVMKADSSGARKVAQVEGFADHAAPRWSHDGQRLVFDAAPTRRAGRTCFVVNVDGTGLGELAKGELADWSPDDQQIVLQAQSAGNLPEIFVQNLDGKGRAKIAEGFSPRWSPDGGRIALSDRRMLRVVDLVSGESTDLFGQPRDIVFNGFAWSPDGKRLAVAVGSTVPGPRELVIVDATAVNAAVQPRLRNELGGLISFSPDGKQIVFSTDFQLHVVDVDGTAPARLIPGQEGQNRYPAFSPDGQWIAFTSTRKASADARPKAAAMPRGKKLEEIKRHTKGTIVYSLDFTPDGRRVVMGGDPRNVGVHAFDLTTGESHALGGRGIHVNIFPDGKRFATAWLSPVAQTIDLESGAVLREFDHGGVIWALRVSRDARQLLTGGVDKVIRIWDVETGQQRLALDPHPDWITRATFSPDSKEVITGSHDKTLRIWDASTGKLRLAIEQPAAIWGLAVSPDGRHILTGSGGNLASTLVVLNIAEGDDNVLRMWERETGKLVREMKGHTGVVFSIDVSPDGRLAVTGSSDGTMRLWDLTTGNELSQVGPGKGAFACVAFSPDGKLVVAGGGVARVAGRLTEFPDEQVRIYRVVDDAAPAAPVNP